VTVLRVLVCEDSRSYAAGLRRTLEFDGDISVAGICASAEEAIATLPDLRPGLVTMDIGLPAMDGLTAVEEIMDSRPLPILVLSAHVAGAHNEKAAAALAAGALEAIAKDDLNLRDPAGIAGAAFRRRVRVLSRARVIRHLRASAALAAQPTDRMASVIGICASTGGPQVVARMLAELPAGYPIPLMIVQHIGAGFADGLARWLDQTVPLPVAIARAGALAGAGAWIAPSGAHLTLGVNGTFALDDGAVAGLYRPSGDVLLRSVAAVAGRAGVAVVLSGMGADGAAGAAEVRRQGGLVIAQDEASSAVYGMPKAAIARGADMVLSPAGIAAELLRLGHLPLRVTR
jgi:two-component system chemotaxis response regulator CheB